MLRLMGLKHCVTTNGSIRSMPTSPVGGNLVLEEMIIATPKQSIIENRDPTVSQNEEGQNGRPVTAG